MAQYGHLICHHPLSPALRLSQRGICAVDGLEDLDLAWPGLEVGLGLGLGLGLCSGLGVCSDRPCVCHAERAHAACGAAGLSCHADTSPSLGSRRLMLWGARAGTGTSTACSRRRSGRKRSRAATTHATRRRPTCGAARARRVASVRWSGRREAGTCREERTRSAASTTKREARVGRMASSWREVWITSQEECEQSRRLGGKFG